MPWNLLAHLEEATRTSTVSSESPSNNLARGIGLLLVAETVITLGYRVHYCGVVVVVGNTDIDFIERERIRGKSVELWRHLGLDLLLEVAHRVSLVDLDCEGRVAAYELYPPATHEGGGFLLVRSVASGLVTKSLNDWFSSYLACNSDGSGFQHLTSPCSLLSTQLIAPLIPASFALRDPTCSLS